jgi:hypothetical protein
VFGYEISKNSILNHDFKMCDLKKKMIFKNIIKCLAKLQFSILRSHISF